MQCTGRSRVRTSARTRPARVCWPTCVHLLAALPSSRRHEPDPPFNPLANTLRASRPSRRWCASSSAASSPACSASCRAGAARCTSAYRSPQLSLARAVRRGEASTLNLSSSFRSLQDRLHRRLALLVGHEGLVLPRGSARFHESLFLPHLPRLARLCAAYPPLWPPGLAQLADMRPLLPEHDALVVWNPGTASLNYPSAGETERPTDSSALRCPRLAGLLGRPGRRRHPRRSHPPVLQHDQHDPSL